VFTAGVALVTAQAAMAAAEALAGVWPLTTDMRHGCWGPSWAASEYPPSPPSHTST
jgi:hypothetical protein